MALTTAQIQNAYVAFFNRPADVEGLNYWLAYTGNSAELLNTFAQSAEYKSLYSGMNNTQLVNAVYQNLFGHAPDITGLNYWVNQLTQGNLAIGNIADAINKGARGTDATIIANKVAAAGAFTTALDTTAEVLAYAGVSSTGLEAVKAWLAAVTSDAATVPNTDSVTKIITTVQNNVAASGSTITLTTGVDNLTGTAGNDTFLGSVGSPATLSTADQLDGGAGTDTLKIYGGTTVPLGLKNIEVLDYVNPSTAGIDISALTGVTKLMVEDASGGVALTTGKGVAVSLATAAGAAAGAGTVWTADNTETSVNLNLNGFQYKKGITPTGLTVNGTATTTVNISSTGNSNKIGTLNVGSAVTKLVASGDKSLSFTLAGTDVPNLDSLDSSAMTAGGVSANLSNATLKAGFTFAGGAGDDDVLTFANDQLGAFTSGAQLDGGAGTDKVVISDTALTAAEYKALNDLKNFEVLGMNASATALTVDASKLTSIKTFSFDGDGAQNITNMSAGSTAWINASHTTSNDINMASAAGASDLALKIGGATSTGLTINKLGIGQTAVALASNGDGTGTNTITTLGNADNSAYTITGSNDLTITNALAGTAIGSKVDASAFTGKLTVTGSALSDVLIGGAGNDVIDGGAITGAGTVTPAVTENAAATFFALTNGQTVTLGSLTFTAGSAGATAAQVAAFFAGQAANGAGATIAAAGSFSGNLTGWTTGAVTGGKVLFTSTTANTNVTNLVNAGTGTATATGADYTDGGVGTETANFTFNDLTAGQTVSLGSLVFTAGANGATAAQVANAFASLLANSTGGTVPTVGAGSGNLTGWTTGSVTGGNVVTFTSTTANTNITPDLTAGGTGTATVGSYIQGTAGAAGTAASLDTLTGNGGSDTFKFSSLDSDGAAGVVTAVITDFKTGVDKIFVLGNDTLATTAYGAGSTTNLVKATATAADLSTLLTAADTALTGTIKYYVGQVGSDAYLVTDFDGNGYTNVIKLTGVALDGIVAADLIGA